MGKMGNIGFINSFIDEVRKTQSSFAAIREKRAEKVQKDELFTLQKRKYELEIKEKERIGEITPFDAKAKIAEFKDYTSLLNANSEIEDNLLDKAQTETMKKQKVLGSVARQIMPALTISTDTKGQQSSSMSFRTVANTEKGPTAVDKTLGVLQQGGTIDSYGYKADFKDRDTAEAYAASNLGPDYKTKYPRAEKYISEKFPNLDLGTISKEFKNKNITDIRQAYEYLVNEKKLEPEAARKWLEENN